MKCLLFGASVLLGVFNAFSSTITNTLPSDQNAAVTVPSTNLPVYIVTLQREWQEDGENVIKEHQVKLKKAKHHFRHLKMFAAPMDEALVQRLRHDPRVLAVEADGPVSLCSLSPPQIIPAGVRRMGLLQSPLAHYNGITEPIDVDVAVLDGGISPHEELNVVDNFSTVGDFPNVDQTGHGTEVAGVLGARDNGVGLVGAAPGVRIWNVQVIDTNLPPLALWSAVLGGFDYVLEHSTEIEVANMSFATAPGSYAPGATINFALKNLVEAGIVVVAGAGNGPNDGSGAPGWDLAGPDMVYGPIPSSSSLTDDVLPAASPYAMAVSGMDATYYTTNGEPSNYVEGGHPRDQMATFSNYSQVPRTNNVLWGTNFVSSPGRSIDVAAPAVTIFTTVISGAAGNANNYALHLQGGTSFAAPHVAGLVALYIAANGRATNAAGVFKIRQAIIDAGLPQSQWSTNNTLDPDTNHEPLAVFSESWIPKPAITNTTGGPGNYSFQFQSVPGYNYAVQSTTNLAAPSAWQNLRTVAGSSNLTLASFTDTNAADRKFYRLARSGFEPPWIEAQPVSWAKLPGETVTMQPVVRGAPPLNHQWWKDGMPLTDGGNVSGASRFTSFGFVTNTLAVANVQAADAGSYWLVATNAYGSVTSAVVTVTLLTNWTSATVGSVSATATSGNPAGLVNGSIGGASWSSAGATVDKSPAVTFDLGASRRVQNVVVWNGNNPPLAAKDLAIEVSVNGSAFTPIGEYTLTTNSPVSQTLSLGGPTCRYVRFVVDSTMGGQIFPAYGAVLNNAQVEMDEVQFNEYQGD